MKNKKHAFNSLCIHIVCWKISIRLINALNDVLYDNNVIHTICIRLLKLFN